MKVIFIISCVNIQSGMSVHYILLPDQFDSNMK